MYTPRVSTTCRQSTSNAAHALSEQHVCHSTVNVFPGGVTSVDHEPIYKLHRLCSLASQLSGHYYFTALSTTLHNEAKYTIARSG